MKRMIIMAGLLFCLPLAGITADTDSLVMKDLEYLKKRINLLIYRLNQVEERTTNDLDSLNTLSSSSLEKLNRIQSESSARQQELKDSLGRQTHGLKEFLQGIQTSLKRTASMEILFFAAALALIILFLILFIREKRRSIDFLVARVKNIAGQNDEILHKTDELENIKNDLEKTIRQQKKMKKKIKKIKKG